MHLASLDVHLALPTLANFGRLHAAKLIQLSGNPSIQSFL